MGLETGTYLDDLVATNPLGDDGKSAGDDHIRLVKSVLKATFPGMAGAAWRTQDKAVGYTPVATDNMSLLNCTAALTLSLTAAATLGNQWMIGIHRNGGAVTIDPNGTENVNGSSTSLVLADGGAAILFCDGTEFYCFDMAVSDTGLVATTAADNVFTGKQTMTGEFVLTKGGDIASASPLVIDTDGNYFDVTGTTGFSAMTVDAGRLFILQFDGALTMTDGASLDLGGADVTTAAGDRALFYATAANTVQLIGYFTEGLTKGSVDTSYSFGHISGLILENAGSPTDTVSRADLNSNASHADQSVRVVVDAAGIATNGSFVRVGWKADGGSATIDAAYIAEQAAAGDLYDYEPGTKVQLTFGGATASNTFNDRDTIYSDWVSFSVDNTKAYVVGFDCNATCNLGILASKTNWESYTKAAANEAATDNVTGYSAGNDAIGVFTIEVASVNTGITFGVSQGAARDQADVKNLTLSSAWTKTTASWAAGTGNGALSSSLTLTDDTWYHAFLIEVGGAVDIGLDTSISAANLVTDHSATDYRRIGSIYINQYGQIKRFLQVGDEFIWWMDELIRTEIDSSSTAQGALLALDVPPDVRVKARFTIELESGDGSMLLPSPGDFPATMGSQLEFGPGVNEHDDRGTFGVPDTNTGSIITNIGAVWQWTNTSQQIRMYHSSTTTMDMDLVTQGWIDQRGKDG